MSWKWAFFIELYIGGSEFRGNICIALLILYKTSTFFFFKKTTKLTSNKKNESEVHDGACMHHDKNICWCIWFLTLFFFLNLYQFPLSFLFPVRNISLEKFTEQLPEIFRCLFFLFKIILHELCDDLHGFNNSQAPLDGHPLNILRRQAVCC